MDLVVTLSRKWKPNLEPRLRFEAKVPSKKARVDPMQLTPATKRRIYTA